MARPQLSKEMTMLAKILTYPLGNPNVLLAVKKTLDSVDETMEKAGRLGVTNDEVRQEGLEALRQFIIAVHEASGALLAGLNEEKPPSLSVVEVKREKVSKGRVGKKKSGPEGSRKRE